MDIGKLPNSVLKSLILDTIKIKRPEILIYPNIGEDCTAISFNDLCCVLTTDPITGTSKNIGKLAVHISCNDIASSGAEPIAILVNILAPKTCTQDELALVMKELSQEANSLGVDIIGGHTEVTDAVNRFVVVTTAVGKIISKDLVKTSGAKAGDYLVMTKSAGLEGTSIIATEKEFELLGTLDSSTIESAKLFVEKISIVKEGLICGKLGVNSMHDVTEGGILGAAWEISEASGVGIEIYKDKIPVSPQTKSICDFYRLDPLKLISSGSLLIACSDYVLIIEALEAQGIQASVIGRFSSERKKVLVSDNGKDEVILEPEADELFKIL